MKLMKLKLQGPTLANLLPEGPRHFAILIFSSFLTQGCHIVSALSHTKSISFDLLTKIAPIYFGYPLIMLWTQGIRVPMTWFLKYELLPGCHVIISIFDLLQHPCLQTC